MSEWRCLRWDVFGHAHEAPHAVLNKSKVQWKGGRSSRRTVITTACNKISHGVGVWQRVPPPRPPPNWRVRYHYNLDGQVALFSCDVPGIRVTYQIKYTEKNMYTRTFLRNINKKHFSSGRESFLTLSAAGHAGGPPVHHSASVGPGQAQWRLLWGFKVAKSGK